MKRILASVVGLAFLLTPFSGFCKDQGKAEKPKPKIENVVTTSPSGFKASPEIARSMKEFKAKRVKQEKLTKSFSFLHGTVGGDDGQPQTTQHPLSQEDLTTAIISGQLGSIFTFLEAQTDKGNGDIDYWIRTRSLLAMEGNIVVGELNRILQVNGEAVNGLLRAAVRNVSSNLCNAMTKYNSGYGDINYWVAASGNTRDALWQAAANLKEIREAIASPNSPNAMPIIKGQLEVVCAFLCGQGDQGSGNIDYWIRTRSILANQAMVSARILRIIVDFYGPQMPGLLRTAISNIIANLDEVVRKYSNGYGDLNYWVGASSYTRDGLRGAGKNLRDILNSI